MEKGELARKLFIDGANCAQAVLGAYAQECGLTLSDALKLASGFGGGVGRQREVCGAVSGMVLVANLLYGYTRLDDKAAKDAHYKLIQQLCAEFRAMTGSIVCRELLGLGNAESVTAVSAERTTGYYQKRPCADLMALAAGILAKSGAAYDQKQV